MEKKQKILFVCTANTHRSPTAQDLFSKDKRFEVRSCGIHPLSPTPISKELVEWADIIFVFCERLEGHRTFIEDKFPNLKKPIIDLNIPDNYWREDPELIAILKKKLTNYLDYGKSKPAS